MPRKNLYFSGDSGELTFEDGFERFMKHNNAKNLSNATLRYYEYECKRLKKFMEERGLKYLNDLDRELIDDFKIFLQNKIENKTSVNTILRAVRAFLNYLSKINYIDKLNISELREEKKIKKTYTDRELKILLEKPDLNECGFSEYRNWVIVNYLLSTGNRMRTVRNIKIKDLNFDSGYIELRKTKNKKHQLIPLGEELSDILLEYLNYRGGEKDDYLFPSIYGGKISTDGLTSAIGKYNNRRGVDKTSIHLFRHTFAKKWIKNGGDIFRLQKILGHSSIDMVKEYVEMFADDLKEDFEEYNPLNEFVKTKKSIKM